MRVTLGMIFGNATRYINMNTQKYYQLEESLLSQKRINRPSDDPVSMTQVMDLRKLIGEFDQYDRNISTAETFTSQTEVALSNVVDRLQRAIELTVDVNDSLNGPSEFAEAAQEMNDVFKEILRNANTKIGNRYIFSGFETTTQPFDTTGAYNGGVAGQNIDLEVARGEKLTINYNGGEVFRGATDIMQIVQDATAAIASGDQSAISAQLPNLQAALDHVLVYVTSNGAKTNRIEIAKDDNTELRDAFTAILSDSEDIDLVAVSSQFALQEQVLEANRLVSSKLMQQNILDFLT
jgi:flagellar hook-associated protein 3 FlgL